MPIDALVAVAEGGKTRGHRRQRKVGRLAAVHLLPAERRRHWRIGLGPHRVGRGNSPVFGVLVVVHKYAVSLLLPPLARRDVWRPPLYLASERQRGSAHLVEAPPPLDSHIYVHPSGARGLGPTEETVI